MREVWGEPVLLPPDLEERRRFVSRWCASLLARGEGAATLFEATLDGRAPRVHAWIGGRRERTPGPTEAAAPLSESSPLLRTADLVEAGPTGVRAAAPTARALLDRADILGSTGWATTETVWVVDDRAQGFWVGRRFACLLPREPAALEKRTRVDAALTAEWSSRVGRSVIVEPVAARRGGHGRRWTQHTAPGSVWFHLTPPQAEATVEPIVFAPGAEELTAAGHAAVFGATGAGKTWFLAERAAAAIRHGDGVVALDLHGDLGPGVVGRLPPKARVRVVAVDVESRPVPGIAALREGDERAVGHLVAAVKRLSPDGSEVYWGFRLERLFDAFVRLAVEQGGSILDVYDLLTDEGRRESARLSTRRPELARFLEELAPVVRRSPDFLWPAAARLSKVALVPALSELLAPRDGGLDVESLLRNGRALLIRIPFARIGSEAASFAASLLFARIYYGWLSREPTGRAVPLLAVLDEVHALSPRLVAEALTEGRKFGVRLLVASQFPDRLAPELRTAVAGSVRNLVVFRTPAAAIAGVAGWLGLSFAAAEATLPGLPGGVGVGRTLAGDLVTLGPAEALAPDPAAWQERTRATRLEVGPATPEEAAGGPGGTAERLLLAALAAEETGVPLRRDGLVLAASRLPGAPFDPVHAELSARELERRGGLEVRDGFVRLTAAGAWQAGLRPVTGATRESDQHRALLVEAFRLFARRGYRLELVRQGRYDTALPDARLRLLSDPAGKSPGELAREIAEVQRGWAWRFFGGRDVHVEAEVSGALRPERIRRGVRKALSRGAFPLFVVGDAGRASRVRRVLRRLGLPPSRAQVWTLPVDRALGVPPVVASE